MAIVLAFQDKCPTCRYAPVKPSNPDRQCDECYATLVRRALIAIRAAVFAALQPPERDCCLACGCLVSPDEHCPGCRSRRLNTADSSEGEA